MKKILKTNEAPDGYIRIGQAAEMLGIDPFDLRMLMFRSKGTDRIPNANFQTAVTKDRILYVPEVEIHSFKEKYAEWLSVRLK
jgi:hypothetical protein